MAKIVSNHAVKWIREHEQLSFTDLTTDEIEEEDDVVIEELPLEQINEMIGRLPMRYRVIINLRVFEKLSHKEIAHRLDISERASVTLFSRAKSKLVKMMKEYLISQSK